MRLRGNHITADRAHSLRTWVSVLAGWRAGVGELRAEDERRSSGEERGRRVHAHALGQPEEAAGQLAVQVAFARLDGARPKGASPVSMTPGSAAVLGHLGDAGASEAAIFGDLEADADPSGFGFAPAQQGLVASEGAGDARSKGADYGVLQYAVGGGWLPREEVGAASRSELARRAACGAVLLGRRR